MADTAAAAAPPSLSFPRSTFAKLSPHPYLLTTLSPQTPGVPPSRTNGRAPDEARPVHIQAGSLSHAHGSALVRIGDTTVLCGVRGEVLPVTSIPQYRPRSNESYEGEETDEGYEELKNYDLLVPNIELATGCAPHFLPGVPPTTLAQTVSTRVYSLLHSCGAVDPQNLRIWYTPEQQARHQQELDQKMDTDNEDDDQDDENDESRKPQLMAYWVLYIDLLFVSFDGNPFDAAWMAVMAALRDTKLPQARWDPDREMVVCSRKEGSQTKLNVRGLPVACTATVFLEKEHGLAEGVGAGGNRHWILLDPDRLEENLCKEQITMVVDCGREGGGEEEVRIKALEKQGGVVVGRELIRGFASVAEKRWREVKQAMK